MHIYHRYTMEGIIDNGSGGFVVPIRIEEDVQHTLNYGAHSTNNNNKIIIIGNSTDK